MGSGSGGGNDVDWLNHGRGFISAYLARRRARLQMLAATEAELKRRGVPAPPRPLSCSKFLWVVLLVAILILFLSILISRVLL